MIMRSHLQPVVTLSDINEFILVFVLKNLVIVIGRLQQVVIEYKCDNCKKSFTASHLDEVVHYNNINELILESFRTNVMIVRSHLPPIVT